MPDSIGGHIRRPQVFCGFPHSDITGRACGANVGDGAAADAAAAGAVAVTAAVIVRRGVHAAAVLKAIDTDHPLGRIGGNSRRFIL